MIPLPRTGQFASASQNQKIAKTEKNRLRLIMENRGSAASAADVLDKERRIGIRDDNNQRRSVAISADRTTVSRFREQLGDDKVIKLSGSDGVNGGLSAKCPPDSVRQFCIRINCAMY